MLRSTSKLLRLHNERPVAASLTLSASFCRTLSASKPVAELGDGFEQMRWHLLLFGGCGKANEDRDNEGTCSPTESARNFESGATIEGCMPFNRRCLL